MAAGTHLKALLLGALALAALAFVWTSGRGEMRPGIAHAQLSYFPDLIVESIGDAQQPFDCVTPAGVSVTVRNVGGMPAGPSTTYVTSTYPPTSQSLPTPGLAPGQAVTLDSTVQGLPIGDTYTATADSGGVVLEKNEANNTLIAFLSLATLPTCTSTPAPTHTATHTATPTRTPTPPPAVGGISFDAHVSARGGGGMSLWLAGIAGGIAITIALGGAAWWVRRGAVR